MPLISLIFVMLVITGVNSIFLENTLEASDQILCNCYFLSDCSVNIESTASSHMVSCNGKTNTLTCDTALVGNVGGVFPYTFTHPLGSKMSYNAYAAITWSCAPPPPDPIGCSECADFPNKRVVGGSEVTPGKLPYQVSIMADLRPFGITSPSAPSSSFYHFCGGSIINKRYILSAAHCGYAYLELAGPLCGTNCPIPGAPLVVSVEDHDVCEDTNGQKVAVDPVSLTADAVHCSYIHGKYSPSPHDIWLIKLKEDLVWSSTIKPVCLPQTSQEKFEERDALLSGWGATVSYDFTQPPPAPQQCVLKEGDQKVMKSSNTLCNPIGCPENKHLTNLCGVSATDAPCQGDSGGPLVVENNGKALLVGVVSYGKGCLPSTGEPGIYVRVSNYLDWIKENTADGDC